MSDEQAAQIEQNKTDIASLKEDLANLENTLELPKDIYVLEPSDIQSGYIIDSNGTIRTNENCTLYKYDVTNINSVYISHRGAASMPVYWLEKMFLYHILLLNMIHGVVRLIRAMRIRYTLI